LKLSFTFKNIPVAHVGPVKINGQEQTLGAVHVPPLTQVEKQIAKGSFERE
jgi:hypothetical protein